MAKILFVVNEHPNEAFSISAARQTAKILKKGGCSIVWYKVPVKETMLGKVLANKKTEITHKMFNKDVQKSYERAKSLVKKYKPDLILNFHSTPHDDPYWKVKNKRRKGDFSIEQINLFGGKFLVIEVKAHYKPMPERILKKSIVIEANGPRYGEIGHYVTETTSHQMTRENGLTPEAFGKAIAEKVNNYLKKNGKVKRFERGFVKKTAKKKKTIRKSGRK